MGTYMLKVDEARRYVAAIEDPIIRKLVGFALGAAIARLVNAGVAPPQSSSFPERGFDLLLFAEIVREVCGRKELLLRTLGGDVSDDWAEEF